MLKITNFYGCIRGQLFVENNLSKKPAKAIENVEAIVNNQSKFNMSLKQDYSKNIVEMKLLGLSYGAREGYQVFQTRKLPLTSAVKTYTKTAKEMLETQRLSELKAYEARRAMGSSQSFLGKLVQGIKNIITK